jgi:SAM-dependent methyltransferase
VTSSSDDADDWAGERGRRWLAAAAVHEHQLAPVVDLLFAAAALAPGERVLDVGCGTGPTTRRAATEVGEHGSVVGLDVAAELLAAAARVPPPPGAAPISWVTADATTWTGSRDFDAVISRFGVMFFADPAAAFANLARLVRPGGRLCVAVWSPRPVMPLFELPIEVIRGYAERHGLTAPIPPPDAGPFSLGEPQRVEDLLTRAGWRDLRLTPHRIGLPLGADAEAAARAALDSGAARVAVAELDTRHRDAIAAELAERYARGAAEDEVVGEGRPIIVQARRP